MSIPNSRKEELKLAKQALKEGREVSVYTGILPSERPLKADTKIIRGHLYLINEKVDGIEGRVVESSVSGDTTRLENSLRNKGHIFTRIHWCDLKGRNIAPKQKN